MSQARIIVRGLSKRFVRRRASRTKGISTEGASALRDLVRQTLGIGGREEAHESERHFFALRHVSFEVAPGEVLGIIGRNGAGKSTLLKILARVLHPTEGTATIRGRVASMLELGIGFAPDLTVRQNIEVQGRLAGIPGRRIRAAEDGILEFAGLAAFRDVLLQKCPSGAAIQLGFATLIGLGADVVLADEVLAVGDAAFRHACEERVRAAGVSGESVLFVSHDMAAVRRICTRAIWIDRGRIAKEGPTDEVVDAYTTELMSGRFLTPASGDGLAASCRLLDVRLLDAGRSPVGALQLTAPGYLDCLLRVQRPDVVARVDVELWVDRYCVFRTTSRPITAARPTTFRAGVLVPADFLNEGAYQLRVRLRVANVEEPDREETAAEERLEFPVLNSRPQDSVWKDWPGVNKGLVSPRLPWTLSAGA